MTINLEELLSQNDGQWFVSITGSRSIADSLLCSFPHENNDFNKKNILRFIRADRCFNKLETLHEFAAALQFPDYFGENWDAFHDCINDLRWMPSQSLVLWVTKTDKLLSKNAKDLRILIEILIEKVNGTSLELTGPSLKVVFHFEEEKDKEKFFCKLREFGAIA